MPTPWQWFFLVCILAVALAGGYLPLLRGEAGGDGRVREFPLGQAFAAGVFMALALALMLPASFHLLGRSFPGVPFPVASLLILAAYVTLLSLEHWVARLERDSGQSGGSRLIPVVMTVMIAIPSFFLGTALGMSRLAAEVAIFVAIMAHKGSAGFALALNMARSRLSRRQSILLYLTFACATPLGILVGDDLRSSLQGSGMVLLKGVVLAMAAGTFLYLATLHELRRTPLIEQCGRVKGFAAMASGLLLTLGVKLLLGEAHHF